MWVGFLNAISWMKLTIGQILHGAGITMPKQSRKYSPLRLWFFCYVFGFLWSQHLVMLVDFVVHTSFLLSHLEPLFP